MNPFSHYILFESGCSAYMASRILGAYALLEGAGLAINKEVLAAEARRHNVELPAIKQRINELWNAAGVDTTGRLGDPKALKVAQPLKNLIYLAEIRDPGLFDAEFMNNLAEITKDGALPDALRELNNRVMAKISTNTTAGELIDIVSRAAKGMKQSATSNDIWKNELSPVELRRWNNVETVMKFPDGFRWVAAMNKDRTGHVGFMPQTITEKTMKHCGNTPYVREGDEYFELRGPDNRAYITVIVNNGEIQESKAYANRPLEGRYNENQLMEKYKAFLKSDIIKGMGSRYDYGFGGDLNVGMKDYIGNDDEFIQWAMENKQELFGTIEARVMMWRQALNDGIVTIEQLKKLYMDGTTMREFLEKCNDATKEYVKNNKFGKLSDPNRQYAGRGADERGTGHYNWSNTTGDEYTPDED